MSELNSLKENRAALIAKARKILDAVDVEKRNMNSEEQAEVDKYFDEADKLKSRIDTEERKTYLSSIEADLKKAERRTAPVHQTANQDRQAAQRQAVKAWLRRGKVPLQASDFEAAQLVGIDLASNTLPLQLRSLPAGTQGVGVDASGGYLAPDNFPQSITRFLDYFMPIRTVSNFVSTSDGRTLPFIQADDTANSADATDEAEDIAFADATFNVVNVGS
ncbi:MAG TPA: phage major capsid protein, partial [Nitrososphaera sp.]|nr:phage major capsid protein [Nitrososphaera sp.]